MSEHQNSQVEQEESIVKPMMEEWYSQPFSRETVEQRQTNENNQKYFQRLDETIKLDKIRLARLVKHRKY